MILAPKCHCSGCAACHDACPKGAISMVADKEGFLYPQIDREKCVNCGICEKVCPSLNRPSPRKPLAVYAAKAKDTELRLASSSGGIFSLLARQILAKGGKVYGAAFDKSDWSVEHIGVMDEEGLAELRGSKYVQSRTASIYRKVKVDLESGISVLFTGTPCHIAALRLYLGKPYDNLYLVDVVCHGAPSPLVWQKYLAFRSGEKGIKGISFRDKEHSWKNYSVSITFKDGAEYLCHSSNDPYMRAFLNELCNRPSCHNCQVREFRSGSDITIADFWGIERTMPDFDDDRGTSLVIVKTEKGQSLLNEINDQSDTRLANIEVALKGNKSLIHSTLPSHKRTRFMKNCSSSNFDKVVSKMLRLSLITYVHIIFGHIIRKLGFCK